MCSNTPTSSQSTPSPLKLFFKENDRVGHKRIIAVVFSYTPTGNVTYGASIFHRDNDRELCNSEHKLKLMTTASGRFDKCPIRFSMSVGTYKLSYEMVVNALRKTIHRKGVSSTRHMFSDTQSSVVSQNT